MSLFRLPQIRTIASKVAHLRGRLGRRTGLDISPRTSRRLMIDPLEERQLLSLAPADIEDTQVNQTFSDSAFPYVDSVSSRETLMSSQSTLSSQAVGVDNDGDFVEVSAKLRLDRVNGLANVMVKFLFADFHEDQYIRFTLQRSTFRLSVEEG